VVAAAPTQGDIWWAEAADKRRPVLVVTRSDAIPVLTWLVVAPVTRTVRGIPTEVALGPEQGLREECAAAFDNLQPIRRSFLTERVGALTNAQSGEICRALAALADC
jgi:mRNA interferase MazF